MIYWLRKMYVLWLRDWRVQKEAERYGTAQALLAAQRRHSGESLSEDEK